MVTLLPEAPPRERVEWLVAIARVVVAGGAWVAVLLEPALTVRTGTVLFLVACYLVFSLGILALVWAPVRFARGWAVGLHLFDLAAFSVLMVVTEGATSPYFLSLIFLLICATIRWQMAGTLWTAAGAMAAYAGASLYAAHVLQRSAFAWDDFILRAVYLAVVTALLGYLGAHQRQFHDEISRLAAWPRTMSRDPRAVVSEIIGRTTDLLDAPRTLLAWEDPEDERLNLAWLVNGEIAWEQDREAACSALVLPALEGRTFSAADASRDGGGVVALTPRGFARRHCRPIDERLRARFDMHAVQSWPLDGELVRGRIFCLDKATMRLDDLTIGGFVARLAASRLDGLYLLDRLRDATALEERVRVARDLHDSLLQSQAGAALQLMAARRLLERNLPAARERLEDVQQQLERGELEMRSFIRGLRPRPVHARDGVPLSLGDRLQELRQRMERQWDLKVTFALDSAVDAIPEELGQHVYRLVQEGVVNAARHADASIIDVNLSVDTEPEPHESNAGSPIPAPRFLRLAITDDGKGFPFAGTYDLAALGADQGPVTLKERVAELRGDLMLTSVIDRGTELLITLPLAPA